MKCELYEYNNSIVICATVKSDNFLKKRSPTICFFQFGFLVFQLNVVSVVAFLMKTTRVEQLIVLKSILQFTNLLVGMFFVIITELLFIIQPYQSIPEIMCCPAGESEIPIELIETLDWRNWDIKYINTTTNYLSSQVSWDVKSLLSADGHNWEVISLFSKTCSSKTSAPEKYIYLIPVLKYRLCRKSLFNI